MDRRLQQLLSKKSYDTLAVGKTMSWDFDIPPGYTLTGTDLYMSTILEGTPNVNRLPYVSGFIESIVMGTRRDGRNVTLMDIADSESVDMAAACGAMFRPNELSRYGSRASVVADPKLTAVANKTWTSHWKFWTPLPVTRGTLVLKTNPSSDVQSDVTAVTHEFSPLLSFEKTHALTSTYSILAETKTDQEHRMKNVDKFACWSGIDLGDVTKLGAIELGDAGRLGAADVKDRMNIFYDEMRGILSNGDSVSTGVFKRVKNPRGLTSYAASANTYGVYHVNRRSSIVGVTTKAAQKVGMFGMSRYPDVANMR